jgi:NAD(P)-dependent dehydrogenase (short-subunit alcohol dehydrogenase family)
MSKLSGKVAVVTGASKGIGASIAEHLAAEGASVVVNYASSKSARILSSLELPTKAGRRLLFRETFLNRKTSTAYFRRPRRRTGNSISL